MSRNVVHSTDLTGNYDINLSWSPDDQQGAPDAGPTLFTALEELGLKLGAAKGRVNKYTRSRPRREAVGKLATVEVFKIWVFWLSSARQSLPHPSRLGQ